MADYNSMKVPELKKLLQSRNLGVTGNKADLVARLVENDKDSVPAAAAPTAAANDDEIHWSEDDEPNASKEKKTPSAPAVDTAATATTAENPTDPVPAAAATAQEPDAAQQDQAAAPNTTPANGDAKPAEDAPKEDEPSEPTVPKEDFALHLNATDASDEARKRAERAKRFGLGGGVAATEDAQDVPEDDAAKKADRANRFGLDAGNLASGLDSALPERRPKRGRGGDGQGDRDAKRQVTGNQGRKGRGFKGGRRNGGGGGGGGGAAAPAPQKKQVQIDPAEKARMDARAKRFAAA